MLKKVVALKNIGLFRDGCPSGAVRLGHATLLYAENGRGKSTIASALRACSTHDEERLAARRTIDGEEEPFLEFEADGGPRFGFAGGTWFGGQPKVAVFDSEFIEENVYSGFSVRTDQRQKLLEFALGDAAVDLTNQLDEITARSQEVSARRGRVRVDLERVADPLPLQRFLALERLEEPDVVLAELRGSIGAAQVAEQLLARESPENVRLLVFDFEGARHTLQRTLPDLESEAERLLQEHLAVHGRGHEDWLSRGQSFAASGICPFCGRGLDGVALVEAYKSYFSDEYRALKSDAEHLQESVALTLGDAAIDAALAVADVNTARIESWGDRLDLEVPGLDRDSLKAALNNIRSRLRELAHAKRHAPLDTVGDASELSDLEEHFSSVNDVLRAYNERIEAAKARIVEYKSALKGADTEELRGRIVEVERSVARHNRDINDMCDEYQGLDAERSRLEEEKGHLREQLDTVMRRTLQQYQDGTNRNLERFGAAFRIEALSFDYRGRAGEPRAAYGLRVRDHSVALGSSTSFTNGHSFSTTLSDADKRTLALAFFLARLQGEPDLESTIVVVDDPVSSLDMNRRHQTKVALLEVAARASQLLILSHDPYFLRDMRDRLTKRFRGLAKPVILQIARVLEGYSAITSCDLDATCASEYVMRHLMVADYVEGAYRGDPRHVATAIRPLLEGYLHRRFPGQIPRGVMLGTIIEQHIARATSGPLVNMAPLADKLREINGYASNFHHDTNEDADQQPVIEGELVTYAERALAIIFEQR